MRKRKHHRAYTFELLTITALRENNMEPIHLYEGWRGMPAFFLEKQQAYYRKPTYKWLMSLMRRDNAMYHGILEMMEKRRKRVSNIKSEPLIKKYRSILNINLEKEGFKNRYICFDIYIGNDETRSILNKNLFTRRICSYRPSKIYNRTS